MPKTLAALVAVAAIIAVVLFLNSRFGRKNTSSTASNTSSVESGVSTISAFGYTSDDVEKLTLKNADGKFEFYYETVEESGEEVKKWYVKGVDKALTDTEKTLLTVGNCAELAVLSKQAKTDGVDYGFENPAVTANVELTNGKKLAFSVSEKFKNGDMEGAYVEISTDPDSVYILHSDNYEFFVNEDVFYVKTYAPTAVAQTEKNEDYFESDDLSAFDYVEFSGKGVKNNYRFEMYGRENSTMRYIMKKPYTMLVNDEKIADILGVMSEDLEAMEVYYFNRNGIPEKVLKQYGLDTPLATMTYKVGEKTVNIKMAQSETDENYYAVVVDDTPAIYQVSRMSFEFIEFEAYEYAADTVVLEQLAGLKTIEISNEKNSYTLNISTSVKDGEDVITAKCGKTAINDENLNAYYQYIMAIKPFVSKASIISEAPKGLTKYYSVTLTPKKYDSPLELTVYKIADNSARYYIELDGNPVGLCEKSATDTAYNYIEKLVSGKDVTEAE